MPAVRAVHSWYSIAALQFVICPSTATVPRGYTANARCVYFLGVPDVTISNVEVRNCRSDAVTLNGHQAPFDATAPLAAGSRLAFIDSLYINGVVGAPGGNGWGLGLQNRFRAGMVSNVYVENAQGTGLFLDASEGLYSNIFVKGAELALAAPSGVCGCGRTSG